MKSYTSALKRLLFFILLALICNIPVETHSGVLTAFGPRTFIRKTGKPFVESAAFTIKNPDAPYTLKVYNGGMNSECPRVSSAVITLNGMTIFSPSDFNQQVYILQKQVYVASDNQLQVQLRSIPGSCLSIMLEGAGNTPPIANAGPDQTVYVTQPVTLNGSNSSDADGNPLTYNWSFAFVPSGSLATISSPSSVNPTFNVDVPGTYVAQLIVNDGMADSAPATVTITTANSAPVANAGPDQTVYVSDAVPLNGSNSSDVDGNPLTYRWSFVSIPSGSLATISSITTVNPTFTVDLSGTYIAQLIVNDGMADSAPDTVVITTANSAPVANAGPDQTVHVTDTVQLNGSKSSDVDGNALIFKWSFTSVPTGSAAALSNSTAVNPFFTVDLPGVYVAQLIVNDGSLDSLPDTVIITTENSAPVANAGLDQTIYTGGAVTLDGRSSHDADGDFINYAWSLTTIPANSSTTVSNPTLPLAAFTADRPGTYVAQLIVSDGKLNSLPDTAVITTSNSRPVADAGPDQAVTSGSVVTLDASRSSDADYDPLTYQWSFTSTPIGSGAALSNPAAVGPSFSADLAGIYVTQLIVNDGKLNSNPDTTTVTTSIPPNHAPVAVDDHYAIDQNATLIISQGVLANDTDPDGDSLTAEVVAGVRHGSLAFSQNGSFTYTPNANFSGLDSFTYSANDGHENSNAATATITVIAANRQPVANAGADQAISLPLTVTLDGSSSADPDGDPLAFQWALISVPSGSHSVISDASAVKPHFTTDIPGTYEVSLIVNDGKVSSGPVKVVITYNHLDIALTYPSNGDIFTASPIEVKGTVSDPSAYVTVNGTEASVSPDGTFIATGVRLYDGLNEITAQAAGRQGETDEDAVQVLYQPLPLPLSVSILTPENGSRLESPEFTVTGIVTDPNATVIVSDTLAKVEDNLFTATIYACDGPMLTGLDPLNWYTWECAVTVTAYSQDGQATSSSTITYTFVPNEDPLRIDATEPASNQVVTYSPVEIKGTIHDPLSVVSPTVVTVNDVPASVQGETFSLVVPLMDGENFFTVRATDAIEGRTYEVIRVVYEPPAKPLSIFITAPLDGSIVNYSGIKVSGGVSDSTAIVEVSGLKADQDYRSFSINSLSLSVGENIITTTATRPNGETALATAKVTYDPAYPSPPAPILSEIPMYSNSVSGLTLPGYTIEIFLNGVRYIKDIHNPIETIATADSNGLFTMSVYLDKEGPNHISARAVDPYGNKSGLSEERIAIRDTVRPKIKNGEFFIDELGLAVSRVLLIAYTEAFAEVDIVIDGDPDYRYKLTANSSGKFSLPLLLSAGEHYLEIETKDRAGNEAGYAKVHQVLNYFGERAIAPVIDPLPNPVNETTIAVEGNAYSRFFVELYRNNELAGTAFVDRRGRYRIDGVSLVPGRNGLRVKQIGRMVSEGWRTHNIESAESDEVVVDVISGTPVRPEIKIDFPLNGSVTDAEYLPLRGTINNPNATLKTSEHYFKYGYATNDSGRFVSQQKTPLLPGKNILWVEATAPDGSRGVDKVTVYSRKDAEVPQVQIASPAENETVYFGYIPVTGTADGSAQRVIVNDTEAVLENGSFSSDYVDISGNMVTAWATDAQGRIGHHDVHLRYKYLPVPQLYIAAPFNGETINSPLITVRGEAYDATGVTVNGIAARMVGVSFSAEVELKEGVNALNVIARNEAKAFAATLSLTYDPSVPVTLQSITIEPPAAPLPLGNSLHLKAIATYSNGQTVDLTMQSAWSSGSTNVATVNNGFITTKATGTTLISATFGAITATLPLYISPPELKSIIIAHKGELAYFPYVPSVTIGYALQLIAIGVYSNDTMVYLGSGVAWSSSNTTTATISPTGSGMVSVAALSKGSTEISAAYQGITGIATLTVTPPPVYLFITSPTDGGAVNKSTVTVTGTIVTEAPEIGITVNGVAANIYGNKFVANEVALTEGANTISATATDTGGNTARAQITVNATRPANYIRITSNIESGTSPIEATLRIDGSFSFDESVISPSGPGSIEWLSTSVDEYKVRLATEGIYYFTGKVTGPDGNVYQDTIAITILSKTEIDSLLKAKWEGMKGALGSGDIEEALMYFATHTQEKYRSIFTALQPPLSQAFAGIEDFNLISISEGEAEAEAIKTEGGVKYSYPVIFIQDGTGLWKFFGF